MWLADRLRSISTKVRRSRARSSTYRPPPITLASFTAQAGALIAAEGDPVSGASYTFLDKGLSPGTYTYKLEDVDLTGATTLHGPVSSVVLPRLRRPTYRPTLP
jgi:hypothetical protein